MSRYFLGIDLGTTCVKSMIFDGAGVPIGHAAQEYELIFTEDGVEQDAELWWNLATATTQEALEASGIRPHDVASISVSTQGISGVLTDAQGHPFMHALSWLDARSDEQLRTLLQLMSPDELFARTGKNPGAYALPQLMWLKQNRPQEFSRAAHYLLPLDFLMLRMTGQPRMDTSIACGTLVYDLKQRRFISEILEQVGIPLDFFAPVGIMGQLAGNLTAEAAREMGLCPGTPVALGAQDQRCAALGAGIAPGIATISLGTAAAMCMLTSSCSPCPEHNVTLVCADADHFMTESVVSTAGAALKWFRNVVAPEYTYEQITQMASTSPCGANGVMFFPDLSESDPEKPAGSFVGLHLASSKADMARALLEGVSYSFMRSLRQHERVAGFCKEIRVFGGGSRSTLWRQILADITAKEVVLPSISETGCLGAAMLAAKAIGVIGDLFTPNPMLPSSSERALPDPHTHRCYEIARLRYDSMRERMANV